MSPEFYIGVGLLFLTPVLEHWLKSFKFMKWLMLASALFFIVFGVIKSRPKSNQQISLTNQKSQDSISQKMKSDSLLSLKPKSIKPIPKNNIPKQNIPPNSEYYDIHPENMRGGTIIAKNTAPIFQNPQITIDANGISVDTNAVLQNGKIVAKAFDPRFNYKDSTVIFSKISHNGLFNDTLDFQYQGNTFHIKSCFTIMSAEMGGQKNITINEPVCNYSGIINGVTR